MTKPNCPQCGSQNTSCLGGGTHTDKMVKYRYICNVCTSMEWSQVPPKFIIKYGVGAQVTFRKQIAKIYNCKKCGLPKKGHICLQKMSEVAPTNSVENIPITAPTQMAQDDEPPSELFVMLPNVNLARPSVSLN